MRFDTAQILKRFFFCERSLLVSQAAWIPAVAPLDIKTGLARFIWQSAETANALRNRVFELRFPSRLLEEEGADGALIEHAIPQGVGSLCALPDETSESRLDIKRGDSGNPRRLAY